MSEIIEFSEVGDFIDTPVKRYSSGMYVKLAFSVAAHLDSEIMIMDEVLAVGDMKFQKKCLGKMRQAARRDGKTVLYVSHNMATIRDLCDRCIVLDQGKIIFDGDVDTGIALYLAAKAQSGNFLDYSDYKRESWCQCDDLRIRNVRFGAESIEALERSEPVRLEMTVDARKSTDSIGLRFEVRDEVGAPLATSCLYGLRMNAGENHLNVEYDLSMLSPAQYNTYFTLFAIGEGGGHSDEDCVPGPRFGMVDTYSDKQIEWNARHWGFIQLPDAKLLPEQE